MKYIKLFETTAAFNAFKSSNEFVTPHVSLCEDAPTVVNYEPYVASDPYNGHDYVEIGGLKWATMNVGANSITDAGLYFQWGDTQGYTADQVGSGEGQKYFSWADYTYSNNGGSSSSDMIKYNDTDEKVTLDILDDAARTNMGGEWRMPTTAEFQTLGNAVNTTWTQINGVYGLQCTDKTDSSKVLFFPACGSCSSGKIQYVSSYGDRYGRYWSSSRHSRNVPDAYGLNSSDGTVYWEGSSGRYIGKLVRGVIG